MLKNLYCSLIILLSFISYQHAEAQSECSDIRSHGAGFTTAIESVTYLGLDPNGEEMHSVVLRVDNNGCTDPECKSLNQYSVEAIPGTYSDISHATISGNITYGGINFGPQLGGVPFEGFRIANINGIGNGLAGIFTISYTLTGGLQSQQMLIKASNYEGTVEFLEEDFRAVLNCNVNSNIIPYYAPPLNGKIMASLIGAELTSLHETYLAGDSVSTDDIFQIVNASNVMIEVFALNGEFNALLSLLQTDAYGMTDVQTDQDQLKITGSFPILNLLLINELIEYVNFARPVYPGAPQKGIVTTQGDTAMLSFIARNGFNVSGSGIKVGVLSDSYSTKFNGSAADDDILRGDLPGISNGQYPTPVHVLKDYPYGVATDEGRAMLQIIHDIAPDAELAFRTGLVSSIDFADGIIELQQAGCDVIVDDITYISEPFLRDGAVSNAVDIVTGMGVSYFTAAGNFANRSYESPFVSGSVPMGLDVPAHNFAGSGGDDIYQNITVSEGTYTIVLQWDDGLGNETTSTDLDIYLAQDDGSRLFGFNRDNTGGDAIEVLPFNVLDTANTNILIVNNSGPDPVRMKYIVFRGEVTINEYYDPNASTIVGQANAENAITVGAVLYSNTPIYGVDPPTIASFSSYGGTSINGINRNKPDLVAPNGVNTSVDLGGPNFDGDAFPNFFGTSASAPHVAALAALLLEAKEKFYGPGETLSPNEMKGVLQSTAVDMGDPGQDNKSGAGLVNAVDALLSLASPSPLISEIIYDTTLVPGEDSILISVIGKYLTGESQIYFNGLLLESGTLVSGDTVSGIIGLFDDRYPAIQVYNPPNAQTNGTDGGLSNPLYFTTKPTIIIDIHDDSKLYAEVIPDFTADYSIENVNGTFTLEEAGLSVAEIDRIEDIPLITVAGDTSNVGLWEIVLSENDPLSPSSSIPATDPLDTNLLHNFTFEYSSGLLSINKLDITIIPKDTTINYGDSLTGFDYYYIYNNDTINPDNNVVISSAVDEAVLNAIRKTHATALVNVVATVRATALVNGEPNPLMDSLALANTSFFISNAAVTQRATALVNGSLLDQDALLNAISTSSATALVNAITMVRATALVNGVANVAYFGTATALVNYGSLVNAARIGASSATALVNQENINDNSNHGAVVILDENDIPILVGDSVGEVLINSISVITENRPGEHFIIPGALVADNFNVRYGLGRVTINPAQAIVTADLNYIYAGDSQPDFTATFSGFVNGENDSVVTNLDFTLSPEYSGEAGVYEIIPSAEAENYIFTPVNGKLYVNPFGPGTKHIKPQLTCVEPLDVPNSFGHTYVAHFTYENDNATDVYIPIGDDNILFGEGSFDGTDQPEVLYAGGGSWSASFDGAKLTWTVSSYKHNGHKTSVASNASSSSNKCNKSEAWEEDEIDELSGILAYPNPVSDILRIELDEEISSAYDIYVYDVYGRLNDVDISKESNMSLEINMSGMDAGIYFVKIQSSTGMELIRVVKN